MKYSKISIIVIFCVFVVLRIFQTNWDKPTLTNVLTWDAFGYYLYLPGIFIYGDVKKMDWVQDVVEKYQTTGAIYQLSGELPNGNKAVKYLMGISILNAPFFFIGHLAAGYLSYDQDGFSAPYQIAISFAALVYCFCGLWVLRKVLSNYFNDHVTATLLLLIGLATNYIQYVAVDSAMSHGYIFFLYSCILWATIEWHKKPTRLLAFSIGGILGISAICRPTEIIMFLIPLLFNTHDPDSSKDKWLLVRKNISHLYLALTGTLIGAFPQLLYWKIVTGSWVYDVGSRWSFFDPHWRVLLGWEKGWFIYTPVSIFMIAGLFYLKRNPFFKSILLFTLLNIWIVIAWYDWRYGASYSARALVQSYPVMAIPLGMLLQKFWNEKKKWIIMGASGFLIYVNLFQVWQYNKGILHYNDMNRKYYPAIFLNANPSPLQMSLLDTKEYLRDEAKFHVETAVKIDSQYLINVSTNSNVTLFESDLENMNLNPEGKEHWLKIQAEVLSAWGAFDTDLITVFSFDNLVKETRCRMHNGICKNMEWNKIEYYFRLPSDAGKLKVIAETKSPQDIYIRSIQIDLLTQ